MKKRVLPLIALLALTGQGCFGGTSSTSTGPDGGIFRTKDSGESWSQLKVLNIGAKQASIQDVGVVSMAVDPQDPKAVYAGTAQNGIIYSLDGGDSWAPANGLNTGRVNAIAIHPKDKCTVFAARANQIMKTDNCSRDWKQVYFDPRTDKQFTSLLVDWFNPQAMYAGTSDGDIVKSENGGATWRVSYRIDGIKINQLAMDPRDSRIVIAATDRSGLLKTVDGGQTWTQIRDQFKDFDGANRVNIIAIDPSTANRVYTVSKYGILQSNDLGSTWTALKLPTPPGSVDMKAFAVNPKSPKRLVYATDKAVIWSDDGGATWTPKKLPTARGAAVLMYDTSASSPSLFLGAQAKK